MFKALGGLAVRYRCAIMVSWAALTAAGVIVMPAVSEFSMSTGFLSHGVEAIDARHLVNEKFPEERGTASTTSLLLYNPDGLTLQDEAYARGVVEEVRGYDATGNLVSIVSVFSRPQLRPNLVSAANTTMLIPVGSAPKPSPPRRGTR